MTFLPLLKIFNYFFFGILPPKLIWSLHNIYVSVRREGPRVSTHAFPLWRDLLVIFKIDFLKVFGVTTYFCFILKGKNKIRKKTLKCDS